MEGTPDTEPRDPDDREQLLQQMQAANEQLVLAILRAEEEATAAEAARADAAYNEARFRALTAISLGAEAFRELPEPYAHVAVQMLRSVHRMDVMIRDVMDFTRSRLGGGMPVVMGPCDLGELAREITTEVQQAHPRRDIRCEVFGELAGTCDTARSEQVFSNLLGNAVTHGADPICLTVSGEGEDVVIRVRNHGAPIPPHVLPRLFQPFSRGYASDSRGRGLGLGLYIVSQIVAAHGGTIALASTAVEGTEVTIRWPRRRQD